MAVTSAGGYTLETNSSGEPSQIGLLGLSESNYLSPGGTLSPITIENYLVLPVPRDGLISSVAAYYIVTENRTLGEDAVVRAEVYTASPGSTTFTASGAAVSMSLPSSVTENSIMSSAQTVDPPVAVSAADMIAVIVSLSNSPTSGSASFVSCMNVSIAIT